MSLRPLPCLHILYPSFSDTTRVQLWSDFIAFSEKFDVEFMSWRCTSGAVSSCLALCMTICWFNQAINHDEQGSKHARRYLNISCLRATKNISVLCWLMNHARNMSKTNFRCANIRLQLCNVMTFKTQRYVWFLSGFNIFFLQTSAKYVEFYTELPRNAMSDECETRTLCGWRHERV